MPYGFYISAEGAAAQSRRLEVIANNMANMDTAGFKKEVAIIQARNAEAIEQGLDGWDNGSINQVGGGVLPSDSRTDFEGGPLEDTQNDNDIAIRGNGFFVVQGPEGQNYLTRAGNFQMDKEGRIFAQYGVSHLRLVDAQLEPIQVDPEADWEFNAAGAILQDGLLTPLAIVTPNNDLDMKHEGENTFTALSGFTPVPADERNVAVGFLEKSNVNAMEEMVTMIETSRVLEANVRMMQIQDEVLGGLIGRMLRV